MEGRQRRGSVLASLSVPQQRLRVPTGPPAWRCQRGRAVPRLHRWLEGAVLCPPPPPSPCGSLLPLPALCHELFVPRWLPDVCQAARAARARRPPRCPRGPRLGRAAAPERAALAGDAFPTGKHPGSHRRRQRLREGASASPNPRAGPALRQSGTGGMGSPGRGWGRCREPGGSRGGERQRRYLGHGCARRGRPGSSSRAARGGRQRHRTLFLVLVPGRGREESHRVPPGGLCRGCSLLLMEAGGGVGTSVRPFLGGDGGAGMAGVPLSPQGTAWGWSRCWWHLLGLSLLCHPSPLGQDELPQTPPCPSLDPTPVSPEPGLPRCHRCASGVPPGRTWTPCSRTTSAS